MYATSNFGQSWKLIDTYVRVLAWGVNGKIWYDAVPTKSGHQYQYNPLRYEMFYTTIADTTKKTKVLTNCGGLLMRGPHLFAAQVITYFCSNAEKKRGKKIGNFNTKHIATTHQHKFWRIAICSCGIAC